MKTKIIEFLVKYVVNPYVLKLINDIWIKAVGAWEKRKGKNKTDKLNKAKKEKNETDFNSTFDDL